MLKNILNYKYCFLISLVILILTLLYFRNKLLPKKRVKFNEDKNQVKIINSVNNKFNNVDNKFIKSDIFDEKKKGYIFKTDILGTGYYLDNP